MSDGPGSTVDPAADLAIEVDQTIAACDGDARAAVRALIVLTRHKEEELVRISAAVSPGYVRGKLYRIRPNVSQE